MKNIIIVKKLDTKQSNNDLIAEYDLSEIKNSYKQYGKFKEIQVKISGSEIYLIIEYTKSENSQNRENSKNLQILPVQNR